MEHKPVSSSNLESVGYDQKSQTMQIKFRNGGLYEYDGVPMHVYLGLVGASSPGNHFHHHVRPKYAGKKIA